VYIYAGSNANPQPCKYYLDLHTLAEPVFSHAQEYTTLEQFASAQQSLLALYLDLKERMETSDSLHFPAPISGRHRCLDSAYREAYSQLRDLAIRLPHEPPPVNEPPPAPEPLRTLKDVVRSLGKAPQPPPDLFPVGIEDELPDLESDQ
jgi:hypothetical protein